jgi:hypothetical protein
MLYTNFSQNWNNKLLSPCFCDVRIDDSFQIDQQREIRLNNEAIGIAKVVALRSFPFVHLSDHFALLACGKNAAYLTGILNKMYGNPASYRTTQFVVFEWETPNMDFLNNVYQQGWNRMLDRYLTAYRDTENGKQLHFALDNC